MTPGAAIEWVAFAVMSGIAIAGALGMTTTMGMFRSAIFLMSSFLGVAGLFVLLSADLLAWLTVMMYVGGMLVMALFMVLMSDDPGGDMMAGMMKLAGLERAFSAGLPAPEHGAGHQGSQEGGEHGAHAGGGMGDMSMFTPLKRWAMILGVSVAALLVALVMARPTFPVVAERPDTAAARAVGLLLMGKYMLAFEAAGLLILLGVFGGVWAARASAHPDATDRKHLRAAVDAPPTGVAEEPLLPLAPPSEPAVKTRPDPPDAHPGGAHRHGGGG